MNLVINENFSGQITLWGVECFLTVSDFLVKIFPVDRKQFSIIYDHIQSENFNYKQWIYGKDENNSDIAIYINQIPKVPIAIKPYIYFGTPLIIKSTANALDIDLSKFQKITFVGGTMNIIHNVKSAIEVTDEAIKFVDKDQYTDKYNIQVLGEPCELFYSILSNREDRNLSNSSLGNLESYIRLCFDKPQGIDRILDCHKIIRELLAFCVGQYNIEMNIRLQVDNQVAVCKIKKDLEDYVDLNSRQVIPIRLLGDKLPNLLILLSEDNLSPYLQFLPFCNRDRYFMSLANVRDICTSLEREYKLQGITNEINLEVSELIKFLKENVKEFRKDNKDKLSNDFYNLVSTTLGFIELPAAEQITQLYKRYKQQIKDQTEQHVNLGIGNSYSEEEFKICVQKFVKLRNNATHSGNIDWKGQEKIYYYLVLIVYLSILERVGFSVQESANLLSRMFSNKFQSKST